MQYPKYIYRTIRNGIMDGIGESLEMTFSDTPIIDLKEVRILPNILDLGI
jgi:hypothetical protein